MLHRLLFSGSAINFRKHNTNFSLKHCTSENFADKDMESFMTLPRDVLQYFIVEHLQGCKPICAFLSTCQFSSAIFPLHTRWHTIFRRKFGQDPGLYSLVEIVFPCVYFPEYKQSFEKEYNVNVMIGKLYERYLGCSPEILRLRSEILEKSPLARWNMFCESRSFNSILISFPFIGNQNEESARILVEFLDGNFKIEYRYNFFLFF